LGVPPAPAAGPMCSRYDEAGASTAMRAASRTGMSDGGSSSVRSSDTALMSASGSSTGASPVALALLLSAGDVRGRHRAGGAPCRALDVRGILPYLPVPGDSRDRSARVATAEGSQPDTAVYAFFASCCPLARSCQIAALAARLL